MSSDEPDAPRNLMVKDYWSNYITVTWNAPESDGGAAITGYVIEKRETNRATWVKAGTVGGADVDHFKIGNLFEGAEYTVRVYAENKVGPSHKAAELDSPCRAKMPFGELHSVAIKPSDLNCS